MKFSILNIIFLLSIFLLSLKNYSQPYTKKDEILDRRKEQENIKKHRIKKMKNCHYQYTLPLFSPEIIYVEKLNNIEKIDSLLFNPLEKSVSCKTSTYDENGYYQGDFIKSNNAYNPALKYDNNGYLNEKNNTQHFFKYLYDDSYNLICQSSSRIGDTTTYNMYFFYDSLNRITKEIRAHDSIIYLYDNFNNIVKASNYYFGYGSIIITYTEYLYDSISGNLIEENIYQSGNLFLRINYVYNSKNKLIKKTGYHPARLTIDIYYDIETFIYDNLGNIIVHCVYRCDIDNIKDKSCRLLTKIFYKYDENNNEILNISCQSGFEDMERPKYTISKTIKSYEYFK